MIAFEKALFTNDIINVFLYETEALAFKPRLPVAPSVFRHLMSTTHCA